MARNLKTASIRKQVADKLRLQTETTKQKSTTNKTKQQIEENGHSAKKYTAFQNFIFPRKTFLE